MKLLSYLAFLSCLGALTFAALVLWLNPKALLNRLGAAIGLFNAWWYACLVVVYGSPDVGLALVFDRWSTVATLGLTPLVTWFYLTLSGTSRGWTSGVVGAAGVVALGVAGAYLGFGFPRVGFVAGPWGNVGVDSPHRLWTTVSEVGAVVLDLVCLVQLVRSWRSTRSWRLKRLYGVILVGMPSAIVAYFALNAVSAAFEVPGLVFLPGAIITLVHFYFISQYRFFQPQNRPDEGWGDILPQAAFLLDRNAKVIGANPRALALNPGPWLEAFPASWDGPGATPTEVETPHGLVRLSPHFDRFGDFVGAAGVVVRPAAAGVLSRREDEVLALVAEGLGNQAIAERLFVSPNTVKRHVHAILAKTGARSRQELVLRFRRTP